MAELHYKAYLGNAGEYRNRRIIVAGSDGFLANYISPSQVLDFFAHHARVNSLRREQVTIDDSLVSLPVDGSVKNVRLFGKETNKIFDKYNREVVGTRI